MQHILFLCSELAGLPYAFTCGIDCRSDRSQPPRRPQLRVDSVRVGLSFRPWRGPACSPRESTVACVFIFNTFLFKPFKPLRVDVTHKSHLAVAGNWRLGSVLIKRLSEYPFSFLFFLSFFFFFFFFFFFALNNILEFVTHRGADPNGGKESVYTGQYL